MGLDVCICTHNPRMHILALTVESLARQTAGPQAFQVMLVDNASTPAIREDVLAPLRRAGISAGLSREDRPGLTQARLHAIERSTAQWMLFVDDDNELSPDFVEQGLRLIASRDDLGCFGGKLLLPETVRPPKWAEPYLPYLGVKDAGDEIITGAADRWGIWEPPGAGVFVSRKLLDAFRARLATDLRMLDLGRKGKSGLASCEDSLMARQALRLGLLNAYYPRLSLRHHLDAGRFRLGYLLRLMGAYGRSHVLLETLLRRDNGGVLEVPDDYRQPRRFALFLWHAFRRARRQSYAFAIGMVAYHWNLRRAYMAHEQREQQKTSAVDVSVTIDRS
jgi:glycosyltransferase involved in cell wall biosynthesis